jgi:hypothetical protein
MYSAEGISYLDRYDNDDFGSVVLSFKIAARAVKGFISKFIPERDVELAVTFPSEKLIGAPFGNTEILAGGMWRSVSVSEDKIEKLIAEYKKQMEV